MLMAVGTATHPVTDHPFNDTSNVATVQMNLPNRYYPMTGYTFEDDAVFQTQSASQQYDRRAPAAEHHPLRDEHHRPDDVPGVVR